MNNLKKIVITYTRTSDDIEFDKVISFKNNGTTTNRNYSAERETILSDIVDCLVNNGFDPLDENSVYEAFEKGLLAGISNENELGMRNLRMEALAGNMANVITRQDSLTIPTEEKRDELDNEEVPEMPVEEEANELDNEEMPEIPVEEETDELDNEDIQEISEEETDELDSEKIPEVLEVQGNKDKEKEQLSRKLVQEIIEKTKNNEQLTPREQEVLDYIRADFLNQRGELSDEGKEWMKEVARNNALVAHLEGLRRNDGKFPNGILNPYDSYEEDVQLLEDNDKNLIKYFKKDIERNRGESTAEDLEEIERLAQTDERIGELENRRNLVKVAEENCDKARENLEKVEKENDPLDTRIKKLELQIAQLRLANARKDYETVHDTYRSQLSKSSKNNLEQNSDGSLDSIVEPKIEELTNEEVKVQEQRHLDDSDEEMVIENNDGTIDSVVEPKLKENDIIPDIDKIENSVKNQENNNVTNTIAESIAGTRPAPVAPEYKVERPFAGTEESKDSMESSENNNDIARNVTEPVIGTRPAPVAPEYKVERPFAGTEEPKDSMESSENNNDIARNVIEPAIGTRPAPVAPEYKVERPSEISPSKPQKIHLVEEPMAPEIESVPKDKIKDKNQTESEEIVPVEKEKFTVKVKRHWKKIVAGLLALAAAVGLGSLLTKNKEKNNSNSDKKPAIEYTQFVTPTVKPTATPTAKPTVAPTATPTVAPTVKPTVAPTATPVAINVDDEISNYINYMNTITGKKVPRQTENFLRQNDVKKFLSNYKNADQIQEVISALCYGYETNTLAVKNGNFRLDEDGTTYLRAFTNDFLCAKVVVNNYTPEQMLAVFGNTNVTYEQIMDGFKSFCNTVSLYGTTATESLPFRYLTNGDEVLTPQLENLFDKLSVVNANRKAGTLNSNHTDDFIATVHKMFVENDQSLNLTEGAKTVAAAMVDSYLYMQANVANGEALYLHEDRGLAKAGDNLQEVDGSFRIVSKDETAYEFTSLLNVVTHSYANNDMVDANCLTAKQILLENINEMHSLAKSTSREPMTEFANLLYQNGLYEYGTEVSKGNCSKELLDEIEDANPALASDIDNFQQTMKIASNEYVPFKTTVDGVDELLGIKGLHNDLATLHNIRRDSMYLYDKYTIVSGKKYTSESYSSGYDGSIDVPPTSVTTTTTTEQVDYDDLTSEEQEEVDNQIEQAEQEEEQNNQQQKEDAEDVAQDIIDGIQNGTITEEEANDMADDVGMTLEPDLADKIDEIHKNPELTEEIEKELAAKEEQERLEAERKAAEEAARQEQERLEEEALISQGNGSQVTPPIDDDQTDKDHIDEGAGEAPYEPKEEAATVSAKSVVTPDIDFSDPNFVSQDAEEAVYQSDSAQKKEELLALKEMLESVDASTLEVDPIDVNADLDISGPTL